MQHCIWHPLVHSPRLCKRLSTEGGLARIRKIGDTAGVFDLCNVTTLHCVHLYIQYHTTYIMYLYIYVYIYLYTLQNAMQYVYFWFCLRSSMREPAAAWRAIDDKIGKYIDIDHLMQHLSFDAADAAAKSSCGPVSGHTPY